jgi:hypothetical protein
MLTGSEYDQKHLSEDPAYWLNKAIALRSAAGAVWYCLEVENTDHVTEKLGGDPRVDFTTGAWQVYRMLCGMSLELLYKAIIVQNKEPVPKTHDLLILAEKAGDIVSPKEAGILDFLTDCIVWEGRYPVPHYHSAIDRFVFLHFENLFRKERTSDTSWIMKPIEPNPLDWKQYNVIWESAHALFHLMQ